MGSTSYRYPKTATVETSRFTRLTNVVADNTPSRTALWTREIDSVLQLSVFFSLSIKYQRAEQIVLGSNSAGAGAARRGRIEFSCHALVNSSRQHLCVRDIRPPRGLGDCRRGTDFGPNGTAETMCTPPYPSANSPDSNAGPVRAEDVSHSERLLMDIKRARGRCAFAPVRSRDPWKRSRRKTIGSRRLEKASTKQQQSCRRVCWPRLLMPLDRPAKRLSCLYFTGSFGNVP